MWVGNFPEDCVFVPPQESWQRTYSVRAGPSIPEEEENFFSLRPSQKSMGKERGGKPILFLGPPPPRRWEEGAFFSPRPTLLLLLRCGRQ